jgi:aminoglycoside/choline kinase family phosphotransferase
VDSFSRRENLAYFEIGRHLRQKGLPLPELYRVDLPDGWFIMEDFGDVSLQDRAAAPGSRIPLYEKVVDTLFRLQTEGAKGFDPEWCCQTKTYDRLVMRRHEAEYFRNAFLCNYLGLERDWLELDRAFNHLIEMALEAQPRFFLHRDFQSRNIMVSHGGIGIIDWQGGRLGPLAYDLSSLLIDPYACLSLQEQEHLYRYYLQILKDHQPRWVHKFEKTYPFLAIQRNLQILGAFAFLSKVRGRARFQRYISPALQSLYGLLERLGDPGLSPLLSLVSDLKALDRHSPLSEKG